MKRKVLLSILAKQSYRDQEPDTIRLKTEGEMEFLNGGWEIRYEESSLTGLEGTTTAFRVEPEGLTLTRIGSLRSQMMFRKGVPPDSLYEMPFGTFLITVCATDLFYDLVPDGGVVDLEYDISIENAQAGHVVYHLDIRAME